MPGPPPLPSIENLKSNLENSRVLSLPDLDSWSFAGTALAVLGQPIKHSISPAMHNAALAELAREDPRFASWRYFRFEVPPADLPRALALLHRRAFHGLNLTVPHKVLAFGQVSEIHPAARAVGAVNTLLRTPSGWSGYNTDGYGLARGLRADLDRDLAGSHILLLGAGGAARGAAVECLQQRCASLWIANRTAENLRTLLDALTPLAAGIPLHGFALDTPPSDLPAGLIAINATSAGLRANDPPPIQLELLPSVSAVYDMIYNPPQTPLLRAARERGLPCANGLSMLVHQGAQALSIWTGVPADRLAPTMAAAAGAAL